MTCDIEYTFKFVIYNLKHEMDKFYSENSENIISTMSMLKFVSHSYWIPDPYLAFFDRKVNLVTFEDIFCVEGMFNPCQKNNVIIIKKKKKN